MKGTYPLLLTIALFCLLIPQTARAQDTITVQTLTLDSDARAGVFNFPDGNSQAFEKILMRYRMRCHDAAVGNGNVGCREWDYSCNTFITDSTRVDSNQALHPNYSISNFSGNTFDYTTQPTYTYYQYTQHVVNYTGTVSETTASIGNAASEMALGGVQRTGRTQMLFTAAELTAAGLQTGPITGLQMTITGPGSGLGFLRIRLKHSNQTALDPATPDLEGFTEVYFLSTTFAGNGPLRFNFYQNFDWDGSSNLLADFSYTNTIPGMNTVVSAHAPGFSAVLSTAGPDYALRFAGSGALPLDPAPLAAVSNEITVSLWAKGDPDIMPVNSTLLEGTDQANNRQVNVHLPWGNGQVYWDCGNDGSGYDRINQPAAEPDYEGRWNHWAFTKNATTGNMNIYLNGALWLSGAGKTKPIDITAFKLGASVNEANAYYGAVDELAIWNAELDQATIQAWMRKKIDANHPNYNQLLAYFRLDEGSGTTVADASPLNTGATISGTPAWEQARGRDLYKNFNSSNLRPDVVFVQGEYPGVEDMPVITLDSTLNTQHRVIAYGLAGGVPVPTDTLFLYAAGSMPVYDESGQLIDTVPVKAENTLTIENLVYYNRFPAKYEILSLVTPYGNGLDLGPQGKVFTFDVTDYAPILQGQKRLSVEMGGERQEELDIQFLFITGTPPRPVLNIQNIWPFRRGGFASIQDNSVFEPRAVPIASDGSAFKIRSSITGHGQNGEFVQRTHYLDLDGGANEFAFPVWKKCGDIPIYPQGGTWLFDRAGWCPGDPTTVREFDITPYVIPGTAATIDYGVLGDFMSDANYLVSNQLVTYGPPNHTLDAAVVDVIRPSQKVEHERFNPACNLPLIKIQNTGAEPLASLIIDYRVVGGQTLTYTWTGALDFLETADVTLPVPDPVFWENGGGTPVFDVHISKPNGSTDAYAANNRIQSSFHLATVLSGELALTYKTNNRGAENAVYIRDHTGAVVLQRTAMASNTVYNDELNLPAGCYTLEFTDSGDDGLYYWYWEYINLNVGTGFLRLRRKITPTAYIVVKNFEPEFGSFVHFDFTIPEVVDAVEPGARPTLMSIFPNPVTDEIGVDLVGYEGLDLRVELLDATGRLLHTQAIDHNQESPLTLRFPVSGYPAGLYWVRVQDGLRVTTRTVVKL